MTEEEAKDLPWPLMATSAIAEIEARQAKDAEFLLEGLFQQLWITARKKLQEAGRVGDVRRLTLVCHNEDVNIVKIVKPNKQDESTIPNTNNALGA